MKPIITYPGGKRKELQIIKQFIPKFKGRYIEPFVGGGALYFDLEYKNSIINDINGKLIHFYKDIVANYDEIKEELLTLEQEYMINIKKPLDDNNINSIRYYEMRDMYNNKKISNLHFATIYFYINKTAYSGLVRTNSRGEFNVAFGRYKTFNSKLLDYNHYNLLKNTKIYNESYEKIFEMVNEDDFVFLDPPYDCEFTNYGNSNDFSKEQHIKLANDFKNLKCKAMIVIGKTDFIESLYKDYILYEYDKKYDINIKNRTDVTTKHLIITNYKLD